MSKTSFVSDELIGCSCVLVMMLLYIYDVFFLRISNIYMVTTRKIFKQALDHCKRNEESIRNENLAKNLLNQDMNNYWKHVKSRRGKHTDKTGLYF